MEFILMRLEVPKLRELLIATIQFASEGFRGGMHDLVGADVTVLREGFAADGAGEGSFAAVPALVGFEVAELAEALAAGWFFADEGFLAGVRSRVDFQVGFLGEGFAAAR